MPLNITVTPPKPPKQKIEPKIKSTSSIRRRPLDEDTTIYGDKLFEKAYIPKRIVYVTFFNVIKNNNENLVGISKCRKYAIEYIPQHHEEIFTLTPDEDNLEEKELKNWVESWNLYFFADAQSPLMTFNSEQDAEYQIPKDKATECLEEALSLKILTDKIVALETQWQLSNEDVRTTILDDSEAEENGKSGEDSSNIDNNDITIAAETDIEEKENIEQAEISDEKGQEKADTEISIGKV